MSAHAAQADGDARRTVAIVKLGMVDIPEAEAGKLREIINQKVDAADGERKSRAAVDYALGHFKELFTDECLADDHCWTQAARAIPADLTLSGSLARTRDGYEGTLTLFAADLGRVLRREQISCPRCAPLTFTERVGDTVFDLIKSHGKLERGTLFVRSQPDGAEIRVDGRLAGKAPIEITEAVGQHEVVGSAEGRVEQRISVEVKPQARIEVDFLMKPAPAPIARPNPPAERWSSKNLKIVGWSLVGAGLAGIIIGAAVAGIDGNEIRRFDNHGTWSVEARDTASTGGAIIAIGAALGLASIAPFYLAKRKQSTQLKVSVGWQRLVLEGGW
jgi:hypothetical protein